MVVKSKIQEDYIILKISGKLMGGNETKEVHENVKSMLAKGINKIVIDLSKVKWVNSQGLGILIACLTSVSNAEGQLKITGATKKVKSLFMITQLITVFETFKSVDQAVASFK